MHFIRFLKVPTTTSKPSSNIITVSTLITISTDLSEAFYNGTATLRATLRADTPSRQLLASKTVTWTPGLRNIPIQFTFVATRETASDGIVCVSATENRADDMRTLFAAGASEARILSAWSTPFNILQNGSKADAFVERKLQLSAGRMVRIWEETREDIARHIWPGGLATTSYLSTLPAPPTGPLQSLTPLLSNTPLNVLELGAGCGLAGIVLHTLLPSTKVTVTDLPITTEITSKNLTANYSNDNSSNEHGGSIVYHPLDWASPLPDWCTSTTYELILVADCTYNTASIPYLVGVLDELCKLSPGVVILLAHKVRHDSEEMFFEMAGEKGIVKRESVVFEMAGDRVDLYVMGR
ncbi:hypothetical protein TWF481_000317 [Arthrobotrys musiformis]|uniref:Uncharacterized protein n=1 Tax=Arthrobotrys musiformis TaxID=47236 RepID=A0AAV9WMD9_9PEZI